ncbi:uncharacterized protein K441DRAFT_110489 [Cenococcum geophilum 1.58]|uniref:uncharacterized protein n=1 Tax=Cenococcum geophilum 1.58 TaxID=794803 RepID=UPI00358ED8D5|nr:hypothetical protein K441DRAFT_110489 [Cenococcum geophilum 1.58]
MGAGAGLHYSHGTFKFKRKHSTNGRQGKIGNQDLPYGVSEQRPNGIFPPVDVVRACYLEGYTLYYHSRLPRRFFVPTLRQ